MLQSRKVLFLVHTKFSKIVICLDVSRPGSIHTRQNGLQSIEFLSTTSESFGSNASTMSVVCILIFFNELPSDGELDSRRRSRRGELLSMFITRLLRFMMIWRSFLVF